MAELYTTNIVFNGYHAYLLKRYSKKTQAQANADFIVKDVNGNNKEIALFDTLMYCYNVAVIVGVINSRKAKEQKYIDEEGKNFSSTIFFDKIVKTRETINRIYQNLVFIEEKELSIDAKVKKAFSLDKDANYRQIFDDYARGGLEIIHEYFEKCETVEDVTQALALFTNKYMLTE